VEEDVQVMSAVLYTVVGIVLGGLIAYYFFRQVSNELRAEADALRRETEDARHYVNALISYLEAAGQIEVVRDEGGRPIQTKIVALRGLANEEARRLTATQEEEPPESPQSREDGS
jgi:hypothetical protein